MLSLICKICGENFFARNYRKDSKYCSNKCRFIGLKGNKINFKGIPVLKCGYWWIYIPDHYRAKQGGYVKLADLIIEKKIKRKLKSHEIVHHIDECKTNDHPNNLQITNKKEHDQHHRAKFIKGGVPYRFKPLNGKWAKKWDACKICKKTESRHEGRGFCRRCHHCKC